MIPPRVIRVDWQAWAASDTRTRQICGVRGYLQRPEEGSPYAVASLAFEAGLAPRRAIDPSRPICCQASLPGLLDGADSERPGGLLGSGDAQARAPLPQVAAALPMAARRALPMRRLPLSAPGQFRRVQAGHSSDPHEKGGLAA